jgi:sterol desaturase/sphingolipid hydroxylase (fatty acid hydroxylase superfamily)
MDDRRRPDPEPPGRRTGELAVAGSSRAARRLIWLSPLLILAMLAVLVLLHYGLQALAPLGHRIDAWLVPSNDIENPWLAGAAALPHEIWLGTKKIILPLTVVAISFLVEICTRKTRLEKRNYLVIILVQISFALIYALAAGYLAKFIAVPDYLIYRPAEGYSAAFAILSGLLFLFIFDFLLYWTHRAHHAIPLLWKFHSVHHRTPDLDALHNFLHPVELSIRYFTVVIPLSLLSAFDPLSSLIVVAPVLIQNQLNHMSSPLNLGIFGRILVDNRLHFIHHSGEPEDYNRNFAGIFCVIDRMFGTCKAPRPGALPKTGLPGGDRPFSFVDYLLARPTVAAADRATSSAGHIA